MKLAVTGPEGFIAWHTRAAIHAAGDGDAIHIGRMQFENDEQMDAALANADAVIHLAGVNRASTDDEISEVNPWLARKLVAGLRRMKKQIPVVYGNSIQSDFDNAFGNAKRSASQILAEWGDEVGAPVVDVVLPNIFGEHGRPFYNSVVATFCHQLSLGETPQIDVDRELPLLHVQRAARVLINATESGKSEQVRLTGTPTSVTSLLNQLSAIGTAYQVGDLPDLSDPFTRDLFNTYRSYTFPQDWPIYPEVRSDQRGDLREAVRADGGGAQVFYSTTRPGFTRGQHFHLNKVERFIVLSGDGIIRLRKLFSNHVVEFPVSGGRPGIVDMPTMWVHSITNVGTAELVTLFYADEVFDPENPDTFPEDV